MSARNVALIVGVGAVALLVAVVALSFWSDARRAGASPSYTSSPAGTEAPTTSAPGSDPELVARAASAFETARAAGRWEEAWAALSPFSQAQFGSLSDFADAQESFNNAGGRVFLISDPTQDPELLSAAYLGQPFVDVQRTAGLGRAFLVFVQHPQVRGASAGANALIVAPLNDQWKVWVAR